MGGVRRTGGHTGELRITEMSAPDAADPPYPQCLLQHSASERVVNFDLNWAAINFGQRGTAPAVHVTITGPGGSWQLVYGLSLRLPFLAPLHSLSILVNGHFMWVRLISVCAQRWCFQDNPPVLFTPGTPYSVSLNS